MAVTISDSECQLLYLQRDELIANGFNFIRQICLELDIPFVNCRDQLISASCIARIESELMSKSEIHRRPRLLFAGAYMEEQVTICALHGLAIGYEVFLLKDFVIARNPNHVQAFDMRLFQAGVVPSTLRQIVYEWLSLECLPERQIMMRSFLELIDARPA